jgi:hypothetical protein
VSAIATPTGSATVDVIVDLFEDDDTVRKEHLDAARQLFALGLGDLGQLLAAPTLRSPYVDVRKGGKDVPRSRFTRRVFVSGDWVDDAVDPIGLADCLRDGASVFVHAVHHHRADLAGVCGAVGQRVRAPVIPHVVISPPGSKGLAIHADREHVAVLQLAGTKVWDVFRAPGLRQPGRNRIRLDEDVSGEVADRYELHPGDLLNIPSGTPHHAWTVGGSGSIHVSLTMLLPNWASLSETTVRAVSAALDRVARDASEASAGAWLQALGAQIADADPAEILSRNERARQGGTAWTDHALDLKCLIDCEEGE